MRWQPLLAEIRGEAVLDDLLPGVGVAHGHDPRAGQGDRPLRPVGRHAELEVAPRLDRPRERVLQARHPGVSVLVSPCRVQGEGAAATIISAVRSLARAGVDLVVVTRGGGSREDLWEFNDERLARALAACPVPVVSAVGHEVDYTIADYVADLRAPTPSAAAELVVPLKEAVLEEVSNSCYTMQNCMETAIRDRRDRIARLLTGYAFTRPSDLLHQYSQRVDDLQHAISLQCSHTLELAQSRQGALAQRLSALDPRLPLRRGFAIVRRGGTPVVAAAALNAGDHVSLEFRDGSVKSMIE